MSSVLYNHDVLPGHQRSEFERFGSNNLEYGKATVAEVHLLDAP